MCDVVTAITIGSTLIGAYGQYQQGQYQSGMAEYNAGVQRNNALIQERQASDTITRGAQLEEQQRDKVRGMIGTQRARGAAQGLLVDSGSLGDLTDQTAAFGEEDAQTIRTNAMREAWGYKVGAGNSRASATALDSQADMYSSAGTMNAAGTLLTGASSVGSKYGWFNGKSSLVGADQLGTSGVGYSRKKTNWLE